MSTNVEELEAKMVAYSQQLMQVTELEASDPGNTGFTKLRTDLEEVIRLTTGLLEEAKGTSALPPPTSVAPSKGNTGPPSETAAPGEWEPVPVTQPDSEHLDSGEGGSRGGGAGAGVGAATVPGGKSAVRGPDGEGGGVGDAGANGIFGIGAKVEVLSADKWYPAVIKSVSDDGQDFEVVYMGYGSEGSATITTLRQITRSPRPVSAAYAKKGLECKALYVGDGGYYDCIVQEPTSSGYKVLFTSYGNMEEVPLEYLQKKESVSLAKAEAVAEAEATFAVPESLQPKEGDTEKEREKKRKKIKALKGRFKLKQRDAVVNNKQASWQAFQTKGAKKKPKGSMAAVSIKKGSIFASPDGLDGKVGVTGSGQGLTEQAPRKKFKAVKE